MKGKLENILKGKIAILGIGNVLKGDDAFGPVFAEKIKDRIDASCVDAGVSPENHTGWIKKERPDTIIIADAVHLGLPAGAWDILKDEEIHRSGFTTHDLSPNMFMDYIKKETGADIYLLAVQPLTLDLDGEMSIEVRKTLDELAGIFIDCLDKKRKKDA